MLIYHKIYNYVNLSKLLVTQKRVAYIGRRRKNQRLHLWRLQQTGEHQERSSWQGRSKNSKDYKQNIFLDLQFKKKLAEIFLLNWPKKIVPFGLSEQGLMKLVGRSSSELWSWKGLFEPPSSPLGLTCLYLNNGGVQQSKILNEDS